jgi:hypothetical protein
MIIEEHARLREGAHGRVMEKRSHQPRVTKRLARVHIHACFCVPPSLLHAAFHRLVLQLRLRASPEGVWN